MFKERISKISLPDNYLRSENVSDIIEIKEGLRKEVRIGLVIILIGIINLYNIIKYGAEITIENWEGKEGIIRIEERKIKEYIIIILTIYSIFYILPRTNISEREQKKEYDYTIILGIIGISMILFSKELIIIYLGIELYNFTTYVIILAKEKIKIRKISIIYLILSSLSSALLLLFILLLYNKTGTLNIETINLIKIYSKSHNLNLEENILILLFSLSFLFKIGSFPFIFWIVSLYKELEKKVLFYQLIIPKFFYFFLFINICKNCINVEESLFLLLFIFATMSIIISSFSGTHPRIFKNNVLLTYSSILNLGLLLLLFSFLTLSFSSPEPLGNSSTQNNTYLIIYNFFIVYIINSLGLFSFLSLPTPSRTSSLSFSYPFMKKSPFLFLSLLLIIFSFIGIPPLSGFFAKFYLFIYFSNFLDGYFFYSIIAISLLILSTILSSLLYLKFIYTTDTHTNLEYSSLSKVDKVDKVVVENSGITLLLSFCSLFSIFYTYFLFFILIL